MIEGSRPRDFLGWDEYEMGLRQRGLGLEVRHAVTPQGKLIEGIFNILQQNQRNLPGFAGFNERDYGQEALQKFNAQVRRGGVHPRDKFLSMEQWSETLDRSLEEYAAEPQNGQLLQGKSPAEKWAEHQPLRKLPDDARFLLASHRVRAKVKANGLGLTIRGQRRFYYSPELGDAFLGRQVFAWFNLEEPDLLTVSSLDIKQVLTVKRQVLSAFDATKEQLAEANRQRRGFMQSAKVRFDNIKHDVRRYITRDDVVDDAARALGESIRIGTSRFQTEKAEAASQRNRLDRDAEEAGIALPDNIKSIRSAVRGVQLFKESAAEIAAEQFNNAEIPAPVGKTYVLKPLPGPDSKPTPQLYWALWAQVEKARPDLKPMRHALTRKALRGDAHLNPSPKDMSTAQLAKMIEVFGAILRDSKEPAL